MVEDGGINFTQPSAWTRCCFKITHSTQPLEITKIPSKSANIQKVSWGKIKPLSLSEIEKAIKNNPSENNQWNIYFDENNKINLEMLK